MDFNKLTKAYIAIRDARSALKKQYTDDDQQMKDDQAKLEAFMLNHLSTTGSNSVATDMGTFYRHESIKPSVPDWGAFYSWVRDNDAFDALDRRIKAAFVKQYMEDNEGALPPGVSVHREYEVRVRRKD